MVMNELPSIHQRFRLPLALFALCATTALALGCGESGPADGTGGQPGAGGAGTDGATGGQVGSVGGTSTGGGPSASGGGPTASGGSSGVGGSGEGVGGSIFMPDGLTDFSNKTVVSCGLTITKSEISPDISTVGIVEFSAALAGANAAFIQFGRTAEYTMEAPVDLAEPNYRTLLLGMVTNLTHHYRVVVVSDTEACVSDDQTIVTGLLPAGGGIGNANITPGQSTAPVEPGFIVNATYNSDWVYILSSEGELVWYFQAPFPNPTRARMSWDGKYMWLRDGNPGATSNLGRIAKIAMDGSSSTVVNVPTSHHDLTVLPDGSIAYIKRNPANTCDAIYKHAGDGMDFSADALVFDVATAIPSGNCHANSLHYHHSDGSYTLSELEHDTYVKVDAAGEIEWMLGGQNSDFTGDGASWERQHGHHLLSDDRLLFFNNGPMNTASPVKEVTLDLVAGTATVGFEYSSNACDGNCLSQFMGDVQRLPGGNTFVTYSSMGYAHEVDAAGVLVRSLRLPGGSAGYSEHRPTLYGPPPR